MTSFSLHMLTGLLVVVLGVGSVLGQWEDNNIPIQIQEKRNGVRCGKELTEYLSLVCNGVYNSPFNKKSFQYPDYNMDGEIDYGDSDVQFPFSPKIKAISMLHYRKLKRGVHDECCKKSCNVNELSEYCGRLN